MVDRSQPAKGRAGVSPCPDSDVNVLVGGDVQLPSGNWVSKTPASEVRKEIMKLGLTGAQAELGFLDLVEVYASAFRKVKEQHGTVGADTWRKSLAHD